MDRAKGNAQRGASTRDRLIAVATGLFAERGFEDTSIESVLAQAGVSRGSLYHHFKSKHALFEAVLESVETDVGARTVVATEGASGPAEALRAGCLAWIELAGDPVVRQIVLLDAPSVMGWDKWREVEERHALGLVKAALAGVAETGAIDFEMVDMFAHVILASMNEIAMMVAQADDRDATMRMGRSAVEDLLARLL